VKLDMHKLTRTYLVFCLALILNGCGSSNLDPLEAGDVILAFGDSLTAGVGVNKKNSYPTVLANLTGLEVINAGISGETTAEGLLRLPQAIEEYSPSLMILLEGGNDILRNADDNQIKNNLEKMIQIAQHEGIQVVLIGVPEKSLFSNSAALYSELAEEYDLVFDSSLIGGLMRSPSKKSDAVHFNKQGYSFMAQEIHVLLSENGAID